MQHDHRRANGTIDQPNRARNRHDDEKCDAASVEEFGVQVEQDEGEMRVGAGKTVVILSDFDIDNLKNYEYLIKEARSASHLALDKLIVLKNMVGYDEKVEKEMIVHVLDEAIKLTRLSRDQNDTLTQYLAEVDR